MDKIQRSIDYNALDHKWLSRRDISREKYTLDEINRIIEEQPEHYLYKLLDMATSAFKYYNMYCHPLKNDISLAAVTSLCTDSILKFDLNAQDDEVFHLSNVFNLIIDSNRGLLKCYDCGTNARAVFLKLINVHRGNSLLTHNEQQRMKREYLVNITDPQSVARKCKRKLINMTHDAVFIMSVTIQDFGHVWIIEKRWINGQPRYHHYQSCLNSHLLIDFIERMDYGRNPMDSMNIELFMDKVKYLLDIKTSWTDNNYRTFADLFAFLPVNDVDNPKPGFCYTWIKP